MLEDDLDLEDDDLFVEYRKQRMEEMKQSASRPRFGHLLEISRPDFELQVTRAPQDYLFIIIPESVILNRILAESAKKHPYVKFIKIVANKCIENYLDIDINVPGILLYKNGDLMDKIIPASPVFGGKHMTQDTVEFVLAMKKILDMEFDEDPRLKTFNMINKKKAGGARNEDESDSDETEDREYTNTNMFRYKH